MFYEELKVQQMTRVILSLIVAVLTLHHSALAVHLSELKRGQRLSGLQVQNVFSDSDGAIVGAKFLHIATGAPVFFLQLETVPQVLTWIDTPTNSNQGLPHSLEHLLTKGTKGRYLQLLEQMHLDESGASTSRDFVCYGLSSAAGTDGFFESFHALLDAIYRPDFTDLEAAREFYHFGVATDRNSKKTLVEQGTVYDEQKTVQNRYTYYFELNKRLFGDQSPFAFDSTGAADEMRTVTPEDIRRFRGKYYRIGPSSGFIFVFPLDENVSAVIQRISRELQQFSQPSTAPPKASGHSPKYAINPSKNLDPAIYPFPGPNASAPGFIHFAWQPGKANSQVDLKLLELFSRALAGGEDSLLQKAAVDSKFRSVDSGATGVESSLFLENSSSFPVMVVEVAGVPGNRVSLESIATLRDVISDRVKEVSNYSDHSQSLLEFNRSIESLVKGMRRSERVWTKNAPGFGLHLPKTDWKWQFDRLAMGTSFVQSISEEPIWKAVEQQLGSGRNIWRDVIQTFHLADIPYATATVPSPKLLEQLEKSKDERIQKQISTLMDRYHTTDQEVALTQFQQEEAIKTKEIDKIANEVTWPHFTKHPPLTPDDKLEYRQFQIQGVPVTASFFAEPPTLDIGFSFDLRKVPRRYYKYLPLFVHCVDSLGINKAGQVTSYSDLRNQIQTLTYAFSTGYETSPVSRRADFTIRASAANLQDSRATLDLIQRVLKYNDLNLSNVDRLRDLVASDVAADDWYVQQDAATWNAGYSFHYQNDPLFFALWSRPTRAHWDARLRWLLHQPVDAETIEKLSSFARDFLFLPAGTSKEELSRKLDAVKTTGVEQELVEYWKKNLSNFSESGLADGLQQLAQEVREDLQRGPERTIKDLKALQDIVLDRRALHVDLTLSRSQLAQIEPDLVRFIDDLSVPDSSQLDENRTLNSEVSPGPVMLKVMSRYELSQDPPPLYVGFVNPGRTEGSIIFYTDIPGYADVDRNSLIRVLASKIFSGTGPYGFFTKTSESGLAYDNGIATDPHRKIVLYIADRVPDIAALLNLVNSTAANVTDLHDPKIVDHVLSKTFSFSRAAATFSERGKAMALDVRDGEDPATIRRFSESILHLSKDPKLSEELAAAGISSICGVMMKPRCNAEQQAGNSLFFFEGSEKVLSNAERSIPIPKFLRVWPSDYWIQ
jgi:Zn-dependent M16 (insulinase) family peptidase